MKLSEVLNGKWIKHPAPILCPGEPGSWDDIMADCPSIFSDGPDKYYLFYTGHSTKTHKWAIGFSESKDLFNWTKFNGSPVLVSGEPGIWDQRMDGPAVFKHGGRYYLFYEATRSFSFRESGFAYKMPYPIRKRLGAFKRWVRSIVSAPVSQVVEHARGRCIGFAVSDDLIIWKKHPENPVLTPSGGGQWDSCGVFSPHVQFIGDSFYMFYGGSNGEKINSGMAVSKNLYDWERGDKPILFTGFAGTWDESSALIVSVIKLEDAYCAFYEGQDKNNNYGIGIAFSYDLKEWIKHDKNPIITRGEKGSLSERIVNAPHAFLEGERVFIFHGAQDFKMRGRSMAAYLANEQE